MLITDHILLLYADKRLSVEEIAEVERVLASDRDMANRLQFLQTVNNIASDNAAPEADLWHAIEQKLVPEKRTTSNWLKIAASVAVLLTLGLLFYRLSPSKVHVLALQNEIVVLPDSSQILLAKGSEITYSKEFSKRTITSVGDVQFSVTHKSVPFIVHSGKGIFEVKGTRFRIKNSNNKTVVTLYNGKLLITDKVQKILLPGQSAIIDTKIHITDNKVLPDMAEVFGGLDFEAAYLHDIVYAVERKFDVQIRYPVKMKKDRFTLNAENLTLEEILQALTELTHTTLVGNKGFFELKS